MSEHKPLILVVDDDEFSITVIRSIIKDRWEIITAVSGTNALTLLNGRLRPDLILLDIVMPDMSGYEVMNVIMGDAELESIPVIFITGNTESSTESRCFKLGATDFITKPFDSSIVIQRIDKALRSSIVNKYLTHKIDKCLLDLACEQKRFEKFTYQMLAALSSAIDAKDDKTQGHSQRVATYACVLGERMKLPQDRIDLLYQTGLLHDIGKIGISDAILRKSGVLSAEEYRVIQDHPLIGHNILKSITAMPEIAQGARWHHERYSGGGYPDGLIGEDIPLIARIICVADAYDAMTSDRVYRPALTKAQAREEILKCRGTQFDPHLTDLMIDIIDQEMKENVS